MTTQKLTKHQIEALKEINESEKGLSIYFRVKSWPILVELGLATERNGANRVIITKAGIEWLRANQ